MNHFFKPKSALTWLFGLYLLIVFISYFFQKNPNSFFELSIFWGASFLIYGLLVDQLKKGQKIQLFWVLLVALVARMLFWFTDPVLEDDFYRYLWDGRVLAHGINPYLFLPNDLQLDFLEVSYRDQIGYSEYRTIYPPVAQFLFAGAHLIVPDSILSLKILFTVFDFLTGLILILWLKKEGKDSSWSLLYFLNPLVLKEVANSAHVDSAAMFFVTFAAFLMRFSEKNIRFKSISWGMLSLATAVKLYPAILLPLWIRKDPNWRKNFLIYLLILGLLYLPFLGAGGKIFAGTEAYAKYWIFNASIFQIAVSVLSYLGLTERYDLLIKVFFGLVVLAYSFWKASRLDSLSNFSEAILWVLGMALLFSPVVDAWYLLWFLPFACLERSLPWISFSFLVLGGYAWYLTQENVYVFRWIEYGILFFLLIFSSTARKKTIAS